MSFTMQEFHHELGNFYLITKTISEKMDIDGFEFGEDFTFMDFMMQDHLEFLVNLANANGRFSEREANVINHILCREIPCSGYIELYKEQQAENYLHNHRHDVSSGIKVIVEFESLNKRYLKDFPSISIMACDLMEKMAIIFLNTIDEDDGFRREYYMDSMRVMQKYLHNWGIY